MKISVLGPQGTFSDSAAKKYIELTGITAEQYDTQLMVRPYVKVNGNFFYGASVTRSIYEVAEDMKEKSYVKLSDESKKVIDNILEYNEFDAE